jgi:hypothetical protein
MEQVRATEVDRSRDQILIPKEMAPEHIPISSQFSGRTLHILET